MKLYLSQTPSINTTIKQTLIPKILQRLKLLNLSYPELLEEIEKEVEKNVLLEIEKEDSLVSFYKNQISKKAPSESSTSQIIEETYTKDKTLQEHLIDQLHLSTDNKIEIKTGEYIFGNLDDNGYIKEWDKLKKEIIRKFKISNIQLSNIIALLQTFEPEGVCARSLEECLIIQIKEYNFENEDLRNILYDVVKNHLKELSCKNYNKIAETLAISKEGVLAVADFIKNNLNPYPGSSFAKVSEPVIPSYTTEKQGEYYKILNIEEKFGSKVKISSHYLNMLSNKDLDKNTKKFLKNNYMLAKTFIQNLSHRSKMMDLAISIIEQKQQDFFESGTDYLSAFSQSELANELDVNPSTISRATAGKYIQTPHNIYPLKYLCPRGHQGITFYKIKSYINSLIKNEDPRDPYSDLQIEYLLKEKGIKISRRRINELRIEMKIPIRAQRIKRESDKYST